MASSAALAAPLCGTRLLFGFIAGFAATLTFHETGVELCHLIGLTANTPYKLAGVAPFGVPQVISLSFWGGVWALPFVLAEPWFGRFPGGYWAGAIVCGAVFPTTASWLVVAPLKHLPLGYGFHFPNLLVGPIVNGLWGLGTAVFLGLMTGGRRPRGRV